MPYLHIVLSTPASDHIAQQVAQRLTDLTADILGKIRALTAVRVEFADPQHWHIGGGSLSHPPRSSFYLEAKVTDGTNTAEQKARFIAEVFSALDLLVGPLAPASYTVVQEVPADAWGYQGQTQAARAELHRSALARAQTLRREAIDHAWNCAGEVLARAGRAAWRVVWRHQRR